MYQVYLAKHQTALILNNLLGEPLNSIFAPIYHTLCLTLCQTFLGNKYQKLKVTLPSFELHHCQQNNISELSEKNNYKKTLSYFLQEISK